MQNKHQPKDYADDEAWINDETKSDDRITFERDLHNDNVIIDYLVLLLVATIGYGLYWVIDGILG